MPLFYYDTFKCILSTSAAAQVAVTSQISLLASVVICGPFYRKLSSKGKINLCSGLLLSSTIAAFTLTIWTSGFIPLACDKYSLIGLTILSSTISFGSGLTYYIPPGIFSMVYGGKSMTGTVTAYLDLVSFLISALILTLISFILDTHASWSGVFGLIFIISSIALFAQRKFMKMLAHLQITLTNLSATGSYKYEELLNNGFIPNLFDGDHGVIGDENTRLVRSTRRHSQGRRKSTVLSPMVISEDAEEEDDDFFNTNDEE